MTKIDLGVKKVKVNPRSFFLHTMMCQSSQRYILSSIEIGLPVSEKVFFFFFFFSYMGMAAILSYGDYLCKLSFPLPKVAPHEVWL